MSREKKRRQVGKQPMIPLLAAGRPRRFSHGAGMARCTDDRSFARADGRITQESSWGHADWVQLSEDVGLALERGGRRAVPGRRVWHGAGDA